MPTEKQIRYALLLLNKHTRIDTHPSRSIGSPAKHYGATMRQRRMSAEEWLRDMNRREISNLIDRLQPKTSSPEGK